MKTMTLIFITLIASTGLIAQTAIAPAAGVGSEGNPYEVATLGNLYWITASNTVVPNPNQSARWSSHYIQTANIDASETSNWFDGEGWTAIGDFTGSYNGQGNTIAGLFINQPEANSIGLFGYATGALIENLGLTNVSINGRVGVGGLVGRLRNESTISHCYSIGSVTGALWYVGGLVGRQEGNSTISSCYSMGSASGAHSVGGLVGEVATDSAIFNSYSTASATATGANVGGLVGRQASNSILLNSYSTGSVAGGSSSIGGLVGSLLTGSTIANSYWNIETSGQTTSAGGEGRNTDEMTYPYAANTYLDWDFTYYWAVDDEFTINSGYPYLQFLDLIPPKPAIAFFPENDAINIPVELVFEWLTDPDSAYPAPQGCLFAYWDAEENPPEIEDMIDVEDDTTYEVTGLAYNTEYDWQVIPYLILEENRARQPHTSRSLKSPTREYIIRENDYFYTDNCPIWSFTTGEEGLNTPIVTSIVIEGNVYLNWDEVESANSYIIYVSDLPYTDDVDWEEIAIVSEPGYSELISEERRFFRVVASTNELEEPVLLIPYDQRKRLGSVNTREHPSGE